jgi:tetratricopeptide (TPR) repeat protein
VGADQAPAVAHFQREIKRDARSAMAHFGLGMARRDRDPKAAAESFRQSLALDDTFAVAHNYLGYVLKSPAERDERIRCFRRAIELDPTFAFAHYNLAGALRDNRDPDGAIAEFRKALELFPEHTQSHMGLSRTLAMKGDRAGARAQLKRLIEINPNSPTAYMTAGQLLLEVHDPAEALRVYRAAMLRADATWPEAVRRDLRYNAACAAVQAGAGQDPPAPEDRAALRRQALGWLRAELDVYPMDVNSNPASRAATHKAMGEWLSDSDLAPTREPAAVKQLPQAEQDAWNQLWADVRKLHAATAPPPSPSK